MKKSKKQKGKEGDESQPAFPGIRMHILNEKDSNEQFNKLLSSIRAYQPPNQTENKVEVFILIYLIKSRNP